MKSDVFSAKDAPIQMQMTWPESEKTWKGPEMTGGLATGRQGGSSALRPACAGRLRLFIEKAPQASSAGPSSASIHLGGQRDAPRILGSQVREDGLPALAVWSTPRLTEQSTIFAQPGGGSGSDET